MSYNTPPSSGQTYRTANTSMSSGMSSPGYQASGKYVQSQLNPSSNRSNGHKPTSSMDLAQQYEKDMTNIRRSVFKDVDSQGHKIESYISHVRIIEDSKSPSSRPPANSPQSNKKNRFLILSIKSSGRMRLHKAKESSSGVVQIGRSWDFDELNVLELDNDVPTGFSCQMGKTYYWEVHTPKERRVWCTTLLENYIKYTNGNIPKLINCTLEYFHLGGLQKSFENKQKNSSSSTPLMPASPSKSQSKSFTNPLRSPTKSASPDITTLKNELGTPPLSNAAAFVTKSPTAAAATAAAAAKLIGATGTVSEDENRKMEELKQQTELERKRKLALEKRKQQELERRKKEELERRKAEEIERKREEAAKAEEEAQRIALEKQKQDAENAKKSQKVEISQLDYKPPQINAAKRGPPSQALSEAPSQMSFEYGDESHYNRLNQSVESHNSDMSDLNNYIDGYASANEEETAPLNLSIPKSRLNEGKKEINLPQLNVPKITTPLSQQNDDLLQTTEEEINRLITSPEHLAVNESKLDASMGRKQSRARAFSRVENNDELNDNDIFELLEEIGYDPLVDDSLTLEKKVLKELEKLQYDKIQTLTEVNDVTSMLNKSLQMAFNCCNHIDPILSLFSVELSTFKEDVEFIESQGKGLQVETTNEKLLMNELNDIVHSVEISDRKLHKLLNADVDMTLANSDLEKILLELYNALLKINDVNNEDNDTEYHLSKMKALQEKKKIFEGAKNKFITNFKAKSAKLFKSVSISLSSKLSAIDSNNFETAFLKTSFIDKATSLLTLSGIISFVKNVSPTDYNEILDSFMLSFHQVFENITTVLLKDLNEEVSKATTKPFSFTASPADLYDETYISSKSKNEFASRKNHSLFSANAEQKTSTSHEMNMVRLIDKHCSQLVKLATIQQELTRHLFGLSSSSESSFASMLKTELGTRCEKFRNIHDFLNTPIESDREVSDHIFDIMRNLLDPVFTTFFRAIVTASRDRIIDIPAVLCAIKTYSGILAPTCHEYTYNSFTKFEDKMNLTWAKEIDLAIQDVNNFKVHCQVVNYVKAYPVFYSKIETVISSLGYVNTEAFGSNQKNYGNYYMLWTSIKGALLRNIDLLKLEIPLREHESEDVDIDINVSIQKHLTMWINFKWALEESKSLPDFPKELLKSIDDTRDQELHLFSESFGRQYTIGNIMRLVEDMEDLVKNNGNPVNFAAYSVENIKSLMLPFKGDHLKQEIANIASELKSLIDGRCYDKNNIQSENEYSISIAQSMEKDLYNNGMHALCQLFITTFNKLSNIIEKYYTNFDIPVDKYIINFNFKKHYI